MPGSGCARRWRIPAELKPFLRQPRVPSAALGKLRRAIEADDGFRRRLAAGALPELVDPIGIEWLRREDGWEERVAELVELAEDVERRAEGDAALRRAERRREAAEQATVRTPGRARRAAGQARRADEAGRRAAGAVRRGRCRAHGAERAAGSVPVGRASRQRSGRGGTDPTGRGWRPSATRRNGGPRRRRAQRDALLAERAERAGTTVSGRQVTELRTLAESARGLADRLTDLIDVGAAVRRPVALPGGVAGDSLRATEHLLRIVGRRSC